MRLHLISENCKAMRVTMSFCNLRCCTHLKSVTFGLQLNLCKTAGEAVLELRQRFLMPCELQLDGALCWAFTALQTLRITESQHWWRPLKDILNPINQWMVRQLPSFFGTQSTPNVNFFICKTRYSGKEAKREVLQRKNNNKFEKGGI